MKYQAIIFDMDGVLFNTEEFYYNRRAQFLASKDISIAHLDPLMFIGGRVSQTWKLVLGEDYDKWNTADLNAEYKIYRDLHPTPYKDNAFPDLQKVIPALKELGLKLAVASNSDRKDIERALTEVGILTYFDVICSGMECKACKPDPEVYETACTRLGIEKSRTLVVEDSEKGIAAGVAAGLDVWAIRDKKWGIDQSQAKLKVDSLTQLLEEIQK